MFGVIKDVYYCNNNRQQVLSDRMYERNIPSQPLKPEYTPRAEQTKFTILGKSETNKDRIRTKFDTYINYTPSTIFNPGTANAPWYGFASNINTESTLRNQFFALQKSDQSHYVPSTTSELYNARQMPQFTKQEHPELFRQEEFNQFDPNTCKIATQLFNNHTQQQIKNL